MLLSMQTRTLRNIALLGELLARGRGNRRTGEPEVVFYRGEGVPEADLVSFKKGLKDARSTILNKMDSSRPKDQSLLAELAHRGYLEIERPDEHEPCACWGIPCVDSVVL